MKYIFLAFIICCLAGCSTRCDLAMPAPQPIYFWVVDSATDIDLENAQLFWNANGVRTGGYDSSLERDAQILRLYYLPTPDSTDHWSAVDSTRPLLEAFNLVGMAAARNIREFYIDYGKGQVDTVLLDARSENRKTGNCRYTVQVLHSVTYRNAVLNREEDPFFPYNTYVLRRN